MLPQAILAPLWMGFELWQLVQAERYLGIRQIERGTDPRTLEVGEGRAALWSLGLLAESVWVLSLLFERRLIDPALGMIVVTLAGYAMRRSVEMKWVLVVLTFEGAVRIGMLLAIAVRFWRYA
ncbi:MAG TPA: hypothetical protein PK879_09575 [Opitutaceae bacterium]|nr:hypothetical protein [Kofleriaceae bacterium]MBP8962782.1 hypothetical protein [Opitutaceae bacterium]HPO00947.1 hypothetical protein [Opitutaceae bacterium]